jgi:hypothetical protein
MKPGVWMQLAAATFCMAAAACGIFVILTIKVWSNINLAMTSWGFPNVLPPHDIHMTNIRRLKTRPVAPSPHSSSGRQLIATLLQSRASKARKFLEKLTEGS